MSASTVGSWCLCVSVQNDAFRRWPASLKAWGYPHHQTPVFCLNLWPFIVSSLIWCQRMRTKEQASLGILWNCLRLSQSTSVMGISRLFLHLFVSDGRRLSYYIMQTFFFQTAFCLWPPAGRSGARHVQKRGVHSSQGGSWQCWEPKTIQCEVLWALRVSNDMPADLWICTLRVLLGQLPELCFYRLEKFTRLTE